MPFSLRWDDETRVVAVEGTLMVSNRLEFKQLLVDEIAHGVRQVRVDFRDAGYIDSSGLGVLVSVGKRLRNLGGEMRIVNLNDELRTLFELTKLDTLFRLDGGDSGGDELAGQPARLPPRLPQDIGHLETYPEAPDNR